MGIPVIEPTERSGRESGTILCPVLRQGRRNERNPFRRTLPFLPFLEEAERGSVWTRNIRHRGEVLHTQAPDINEDLQSGNYFDVVKISV